MTEAVDSRDRRRGRRWAMKALFMWDAQAGGDAAVLLDATVRMEAVPNTRQEAGRGASDDPDGAEWSEPAAGGRTAAARAFAQGLLAGAIEHHAVIDPLLDSVATSWSVGRMAAVDRAIVRLGAYELMYGDVPEAVAVSEAVELARQYSTVDSPRFVNGVLGALAPRRARGVAAPGGVVRAAAPDSGDGSPPGEASDR